MKKSLQFHGEVFGKTSNNSSLLADTMLGQMVNFLHGGPDFLLTMTPVSKLNADFLNQAVEINVRDLSNSSGRLKANICDGNRTNQSFFKKYETVEGIPWLRVDGI